MIIDLDPGRVLILSILVLWMGSAINKRISILQRFNIPVAVTGGLLCSISVAILAATSEIRIAFDLALRDLLLLVFFSTIGLSAKLRLLREGGRGLAILGALTFGFLILQNAIGISLATVMGAHWGYGLIAGSISLAGGHGTAITWGALAGDAGLSGATSTGIAFATFGLICGGFVGGPIATYLIRRDSLSAEPEEGGVEEANDEEFAEDGSYSVTTDQVIRTTLMLAICIGTGSELNSWLSAKSVVLPGFLTSMGVGIVLTNVADWSRRPLHHEAIDLLNSISLQLFLAMSLMSMQLTELAGAAGPVLLTLAAQVALAVGFAIFVVYRFCGRDYNAAVIASGYSGLCLGATPVGIANMNAVTSRFGPSPKAFIIVPLVGAFLLDLINAFVIQGYIEVLK
jgi:ESS family glutamate:Na+ symporter